MKKIWFNQWILIGYWSICTEHTGNGITRDVDLLLGMNGFFWP